MLVLSRKKNDSIMIGDDIIVTIVDYDGDRVKIGIDAPKNIRVFRKELIETAEDNAAASKVNIDRFEELLGNIKK